MEKVANLVGTTQNSVSMHERGKQYPTPDTIDRYLAIYDGDVTLGEIHAFYQSKQDRASTAPPDKEIVT